MDSLPISKFVIWELGPEESCLLVELVWQSESHGWKDWKNRWFLIACKRFILQRHWNRPEENNCGARAYLFLLQKQTCGWKTVCLKFTSVLFRTCLGALMLCAMPLIWGRRSSWKHIKDTRLEMVGTVACLKWKVTTATWKLGSMWFTLEVGSGVHKVGHAHWLIGMGFRLVKPGVHMTGHVHLTCTGCPWCTC